MKTLIILLLGFNVNYGLGQRTEQGFYLNIQCDSCYSYKVPFTYTTNGPVAEGISHWTYFYQGLHGAPPEGYGVESLMAEVCKWAEFLDPKTIISVSCKVILTDGITTEAIGFLHL